MLKIFRVKYLALTFFRRKSHARKKIYAKWIRQTSRFEVLSSPKHSLIPLLALDRSKLLACKIEGRLYIRIVYIRVLNIRCRKYFVFYFRSRTGL